MVKRKITSAVLVLCLLVSTVSICFGSVFGVTTATGIEYNASRLHTMDDEVNDKYIVATNCDSHGFVTDSDESHGQVLQIVGGDYGRVGFEDFDVKKDRKYYIYFDAKSDTSGATPVTLIGINGSSTGSCRHFLTSHSNRNDGIQYYIDGVKTTAGSFMLSTEWRRYGIVIDTSNEAFLASVASYDTNFWSRSIHFLFGVRRATAYFDNMQLIEIQSLPDAVADETNVSAAVSVRLPKTAVENNGAYLSAGLRFMGTIDDDVKSNADEIGFILSPSAAAVKDADWYDISNGPKTDVRTAVCYKKDEKDIIYTKGIDYTAYQVILTGLSTESGKTAYIQRYSAAMYVKTGEDYIYYSLGETSFNEVCAKYYTLNLKSGHIDTGVELVLNGKAYKSSLTVGDTLPTVGTYISDEPARYMFDGWYDSTLTNKYTTVPDNTTRLYAKFDGYNAYSFETGAVYDPNNQGNITAVTDPFDGKGTVLYSPLIRINDNVHRGNHRGIAPSVMDGISSAGFNFEKGHTYDISFYYRYAEDDPSEAKCSLDVYAVSPAGIYLSDSKTQITPAFTEGSGSLTNLGDWTLCRFTVTNTTDHPHLFIRFVGASSTVLYNFYIDELTILDTTDESDTFIKLSNGGIIESTELAVGDALPALTDYNDELTGRTYEFDGWYDAAFTAKYTAVDASIDTYYAKYNTVTDFSFESGGMYDPYNRYSVSSGGIPSWFRVPDPTGRDNICMRANLDGNGNNTHFALSLFEGSTEGYTLTEGKKYVMSFDYYIESAEVSKHSISVRGSAQANVGKSGGKTDSLASCELGVVNQWHTTAFMFTAKGADTTPYFIIMSQGSGEISNLRVYLDNVSIREYSADDTVTLKTTVYDVTFNDNGDVSTYGETYIGAELAEPNGYYGAEFIGWYNETLTVPYSTVPMGNTVLYAKYDSSVINLEDGGVFDPNQNFGTGNSAYSIVSDPTDSTNNAIKTSLANNVGNLHFAPTESGYGTDGYKLTIGNTYTISFKYYAEDLNSNGVSVQFRGCKTDNIGLNGGKSNGYGGTKLTVEKQWTNVSVTFKYEGANLTDVIHPYLIMLAQDGSASSGSSACTATVYFDDIVIKETVAAKNYLQKSVKVGGWTLGYQARPHYIVVPEFNFSYLAMMQCEELVELIKNTTATSCEFEIVTEDEWTESSNQFNIFVGDVTGHSRDNSSHKVDTTDFTTDDYGINFGGGNIYVNGGSTYALAMGISELGKMLEAASDGSALSGKFTGKYSEKIDSYSTATYYRPTFLEDFDGEDIDASVWNEVDGSAIQSVTEGKLSIRSAEHTYLENGNLVIEGAFDDNYYYGGMLRSHGKMEYRYGYVEISCITPHGGGLWTAMWATPNGGTSGLYRSEIDVNESFGNARYTNFNMHSWLTTAGANLGYSKYSLDGRYSGKRADAGEGKTFNDEFHTFGYFWTEDRGVFTVDGAVHFEYIYDKSSNYYKNDIDAFNEKMSLIVSMTVGNPSHSAQFDLDETADYWNTSNKYIVDYVHIYQIDGQEIHFTPPEAE